MCLRVVDHLVKNHYVLFEDALLLVDVGQNALEPAFAGLDFSAEACFGLVDEVTIMLPFNTSRKTGCMRRPMVMVARWIKKSRLPWIDS